VRIVTAGAGAAGIACMDMLLTLGAKREHILLCDSKGVIYKGRGHTNKYKEEYAAPEDTKCKSLEDAMSGADVFIGLSGPNTVSQAMVKSMASKPVIFALSNPDPEIAPEEAEKARDDMIMATGRSDYPNQVNNVLCFPFMFRGALDVRAKSITKEMKAAATKALSQLAREPIPDQVCKDYHLEGDDAKFGPTNLLPKPLDKRLCMYVASAVAKAAVDSGAARLPYPEHYPDPPKLE
jgi:malate dehydrogenase (oxaloacetate-decarboxylating)(NADP+)